MKKICESCGQLFLPNPKVPDQKFCRKKKCQRKRRSLWQKKKRSTDIAYRENQKDAQKAWVERNKGYWMKYRKDHIEYTDKNRKMQRKRNINRKKVQNPPVFANSKIAKMDVLNQKKYLIPGYYKVTFIGEIGIAKMDALIAKIEFITADYKDIE